MTEFRPRPSKGRGYWGLCVLYLQDRRLFEASGYTILPEAEVNQSPHGEVIGTIDSEKSKSSHKGLEVALVNGQIVLDRSSLVLSVLSVFP